MGLIFKTPWTDFNPLALTQNLQHFFSLIIYLHIFTPSSLKTIIDWIFYTVWTSVLTSSPLQVLMAETTTSCLDLPLKWSFILVHLLALLLSLLSTQELYVLSLCLPHPLFVSLSTHWTDDFSPFPLPSYWLFAAYSPPHALYFPSAPIHYFPFCPKLTPVLLYWCSMLF